MDKFVIRGGNPLVGTIRVSGAKNSALPCMAAAILTEDEITLENIPQVRDIETERKLLASMGAEVGLREGRAHDRITISCRTLSDPVARYEIVKTMRASSLVLGPLVARAGMARVAMPGGCAIGGRPIDLHIKGLEKMGAVITQEHGYLEARADRLRGAHLVFDKITVTGTEDLLMAAVLAEGETVMENCAREPEVSDLAALLTAMGANIQGAGTSTISVQGVTSLHGARYRINPDRIEAGTFLIAGAITGGDLVVSNCNPAHLGAVIANLAAGGRSCGYSGARSRPRARHRKALAPPTSQPRSIRAFPPTCRLSTWLWPHRPRASARSGKTSSRTASCMCRNWCAWAPTSRWMAAQPRCADRPAYPPQPSCVLTCAPRHRSCSPRWSPMASPSSTASTTWTAAMSASRKSCAPSAPRSAAWATSFLKTQPERKPGKRRKARFLRFLCPGANSRRNPSIKPGKTRAEADAGNLERKR